MRPINLDISTGETNKAKWILKTSPVSGDGAPRPADVVTNTLKSPPWVDQVGSQWISNRANANDDPQTDFDDEADFLFEYCFMLCPGFRDPVLDMQIRVDDHATILLNERPIAPTSPHVSLNHIEGTDPVRFTLRGGFRSGSNSLKVVVHNDYHTLANPMGLNILGTMTAVC